MISPGVDHNTSLIWSWGCSSFNTYPKSTLNQETWKTVLLVLFMFFKKVRCTLFLDITCLCMLHNFLLSVLGRELKSMHDGVRLMRWLVVDMTAFPVRYIVCAQNSVFCILEEKLTYFWISEGFFNNLMLVSLQQSPHLPLQNKSTEQHRQLPLLLGEERRGRCQGRRRGGRSRRTGAESLSSCTGVYGSWQGRTLASSATATAPK